MDNLASWMDERREVSEKVAATTEADYRDVREMSPRKGVKFTSQWL